MDMICVKSECHNHTFAYMTTSFIVRSLLPVIPLKVSVGQEVSSWVAPLNLPAEVQQAAAVPLHYSGMIV